MKWYCFDCDIDSISISIHQYHFANWNMVVFPIDSTVFGCKKEIESSPNEEWFELR